MDNPKINTFLNGIEHFPHAYVLACLMDCQIKAEKAWSIPFYFYIKGAVELFALDRLASCSLTFYQNLFMDQSFHRFNVDMAGVFYSGVHLIIEHYDSDAPKIWSGNPSSAAVVYRLLQFKVCGIKIATMATNILARQFNVPFSDYYSIDISPDVHVDRVLKRSGMVHPDSSREAHIYKVCLIKYFSLRYFYCIKNRLYGWSG